MTTYKDHNPQDRTTPDETERVYVTPETTRETAIREPAMPLGVTDDEGRELMVERDVTIERDGDLRGTHTETVYEDETAYTDETAYADTAYTDEHDHGDHATTGGATATGAGTGALVGGVGGAIAGGPIGAVVGAVIGAVGGAAAGFGAEQAMHGGEDPNTDHDHDTTYVREEDRLVEPGYVTTEERTSEPVYRREMVTDEAMTTGTMAGREMTENERIIQLREEELVARKERERLGEVEIHKDVVAEHRSVEVPVTREEVYIDRHPVAGKPADRPIEETDETIHVPVTEEHVSAEKRAVVAEEIHVGKRTVSDTEHLTGTVRREVAEVETEGDVHLEGTEAEHRIDRDRR